MLPPKPIPVLCGILAFSAAIFTTDPRAYASVEVAADRSFLNGAAAAEPGDVELPQIPMPEGEVNFDGEFLERLMLSPHFTNYLSHAPAVDKIPAKDKAERDFAVLIEIFKLVQTFANQFQETNEKSYATIGDFRAYYVHSLPKMFPASVRVQVEAFQTTTNLESRIIMKNTGGGAGVRVELHPIENGTFTFSFDPIYGEKRSVDASNAFQQGGTDWILRTSAGVGYTQKVAKNVEPGIQVFFQPQLIDFGQFRLYTEAFVRLKLINDKLGGERRYAIQDVSIVPKVVYWYSTDTGGLFGDPIASRLGDNYFKLASNLYGFINLEFHFAL